MTNEIDRNQIRDKVSAEEKQETLADAPKTEVRPGRRMSFEEALEYGLTKYAVTMQRLAGDP